MIKRAVLRHGNSLQVTIPKEWWEREVRGEHKSLRMEVIENGESLLVTPNSSGFRDTHQRIKFSIENNQPFYWRLSSPMTIPLAFVQFNEVEKGEIVEIEDIGVSLLIRFTGSKSAVELDFPCTRKILNTRDKYSKLSIPQSWVNEMGVEYIDMELTPEKWILIKPRGE